MTGSDSAAPFSLARHISIRVGVVALITSVIQLLVIAISHYVDYDDDMIVEHVRLEVGWLARGVAQAPGGLTFRLPDGMGYYADEHQQYAFRVLDHTGAVIASGQPAVLDEISPWQPSSGKAMPRFWLRKLDDSPRHFAGGEHVHIGDADVLIEIAVRGDPAGVHSWIVGYETLEDMWLTIVLFTLLIPAAALLSVRSGLRFLTEAAQQADQIDPQAPLRHIEFPSIPSEAAPFALAINSLLKRVGALMHSHRIFMGSAAHELRTPLAAMLIDLAKLDDPRARVLERDVVCMSESIDRLLTLVRLEGAEPPELENVDVGAVVWDTINSLQEWIRAQQHEVALDLHESGSVRGDHVAIREAVRNLVENAVRHTPAGTPIRVTVGPKCTITVEDGGPGLPAPGWDQLFEPFHKGLHSRGAGLGLTIVRRAVDMHRGSIEVGRSPLGGARFDMRFA